MLSSYHWVYLVSDIIGTYIIFKFMCIFFERAEVNKKIEFASYAILYLVGGIIYITFNSAVINIIFNLVAFYLLTLNYRAKIKKRLSAVILVYSLLSIIEAVTALLSIHIGLENYIKQIEIIYIIEFLAMRVLSLIVVLSLSKYKMIKKKIELPLIYWIAIILVSSTTLFLTLVLIFNVSNDNYCLIVFSITILFLVNLFIFYLYDALLKKCIDNPKLFK